MYYVSISDSLSFSYENYSSGWIYDENWETPELSEGVWYWRVMARDNAGNVGENSQTRWFRVDVTPPDNTSPITPDNGAKFNENQISLSWAITENEIDGSPEYSQPITYQVSLSAFENFDNENFSPWIEENSWTTWEVSDNVWYWRVRVRDNAGNVSEWSENRAFIVDTTPPTKPSPYEPENQINTNDNTPTLRWYASFDLTNVVYRVWIATDPNFDNIVQDTGYTINTTFYNSPYLADNVYYWRVQARDEFNNFSENSDTMWFRLDTVAPVAPDGIWPVADPGDATAFVKDNSPLFVWNVPAGEDSLPCTYWIEILNVDLNVIRTVYWISGENWEYDNEFNSNSFAANYYWRIKAKDNAGNVGEFSANIPFFVDRLAPTTSVPQSPIYGENTNDNTPKIEWYHDGNENSGEDEPSDPIKFKLWVSLDNDFSPENIVLETQWITDNFYQFTSELPDNLYYWKVGVKDAAENWPDETGTQTEGNIGENSPTYWFRVDTLPPENVWLENVRNSENPSNFVQDGGTVSDNTPIFEWHAGVDNSLPILYQVQVSLFTDFHENSALSPWIENDNWECTYLADNDYYWRVWAVDNAGNLTVTGYWRIRIDTLPPPVPELYYPYYGMTLSDNTPRLEWENVWDISSPVWHKVWVATDENFENIVAESPWLSSLDNDDEANNRMYWVIDNTIYGNYLPDNVYYWRVWVKDNAQKEQEENSATWTFRVDFTPPNTPNLYSPENIDTDNKNLQVTFGWENITTEVDGTPEPLVIYLFQLAVGADWDNQRGGLVENLELIAENFYNYTFSMYRTYYWRVRPRDNAQPTPNWGDWSEVRRITIARWVAIDSWNVAVKSRPVSWNLTDSWSGAIKSRSVSWQVMEEWSGVIRSRPVSWQVIETWSTQASAPAVWHAVETWTGVIHSRPVSWHLMESWSGTVKSRPVSWQVIETWVGTVHSRPVIWRTTETWTGIVGSRPVEWRLVESWTGTIKSRPVAWRKTESWMAKVESRPVSWKLVESWTGIVQSRPVSWRTVESWSVKVSAPAVWVAVESWTNAVRSKSAVWHMVESSSHGVGLYAQDLWNGDWSSHGVGLYAQDLWNGDWSSHGPEEWWLQVRGQFLSPIHTTKSR